MTDLGLKPKWGCLEILALFFSRHHSFFWENISIPFADLIPSLSLLSIRVLQGPGQGLLLSVCSLPGQPHLFQHAQIPPECWQFPISISSWNTSSEIWIYTSKCLIANFVLKMSKACLLHKPKWAISNFSISTSGTSTHAFAHDLDLSASPTTYLL